MNPVFDERRYLIPFRSGLLPQIFCETLVVGGGVAGTSAAIEASRDGGDVILLSKSSFDNTNTSWAQGGVAAVLRDDDSFGAHSKDTLKAGAGLCDPTAVKLVIEEGAARVRTLIDMGAEFDQDPNASGNGDAIHRLSVGREGGHSASRVYHAGGDATGREFQRVLIDQVQSNDGVRVFEGCFALDLITPSDEPGAPVLGAITYHPKYGLQMIWARSTVLAAGGAGLVYRETTNPRAATADGIAMAYRAGASLADMAFCQFHPTTLYLPGAPRSLITEAVRGEGAVLLDSSERAFMRDVHELADLAPRDIVARAIVKQIATQGGRHVWLDCRGVKNFAGRFPGIDAMLKRFELDASTDLLPVHPAAHYMIGGVRTDADGRTDVPNLFAVGEVACTGLNGANRLASNSLLEGLVMGSRAGMAARAAATNGAAAPTTIVSDIRPSEHGELDLTDVRSSLRSAMWKNVGIERTGAKLKDAGAMFDFWATYTLDKIFDDPAGWETQNMLLVAALMARSAGWRQESRGAHLRTEFAGPDDTFRAHDCWRRGSDQVAVVPFDSLLNGETSEAVV